MIVVTEGAWYRAYTRTCTHAHTHTGEQGEGCTMKQTQSCFLDNQCAPASGEFER